MDQVRNFTSKNSTLMNVLFIVVGLIVVYYAYLFFTAGSDYEIALMDTQADANPQSQQVYFLPIGNSNLRIQQGGSYTLSFWIYITSWDFRSGLPKHVLSINDTKITTNDLLTVLLYPNEPKMMIRVFNDSNVSGDKDYTNNANYAALFSGADSASLYNPNGTMPLCDLQDIDLQRWINITISVNSRIVDVYYDGKLARSCILPGVPAASSDGSQAVVFGRNSGFFGQISGISFFGYPITPDRIYALYQAGPAAPGSFLSYIAYKFGWNIKYSGYKGADKGETKYLTGSAAIRG